MKKLFSIPFIALTLLIGSCNSDKKSSGESTTDATTSTSGQEAVKDNESAKELVKIAAGTKDNSTRVADLKQWI